MSIDSKAWTLFIPKGSATNTSRNVFILKQHEEKWQKLKRAHAGNYYLTSILRGIFSLNALAVSGTGTPEPITLEGAEIHYRLNTDGDVLLLGVRVDKGTWKASSKQATGLYTVKYLSTDRSWETQPKKELKMTLRHKWADSHYAAVSGKFKNKEQAGEILYEHIEKGYRLAQSTTQDAKNHYSLYWQNGQHKNDEQRDHLVSLIQQALSAKEPVSWLVHGEGAGTFVRAMEVLASYPSLSRAEAADEQIALNLRRATSKQRVFFSNPRGEGTNEKELKRLSQVVGFDYVGVNINAYDMFNEDSRANAVDSTLSFSAKVAIGGATGAVGLSSLLKSLDLATSSASVYTTAGFLAAGYIVSKGSTNTVCGYARSIHKAWGSTVGDQNQRWAS